jgi:hypothetical protein
MSRPYVTAKRLVELERTTSDRDRAVLATLVRLRVATGAQLSRLHFTEVQPRQTRLALESLVRRHLAVRLPRLVGGVRAGSAGYVYALDAAGLRLVRPARRPGRPWAVGAAFLTHSLAVTELYVGLVEQERAGKVRLVDFATEPACWRSFYGPGGGRLVLKPDAFAVLRLGDGRYEDRWFIEVDQGTESLPTIGRKCEAYRRYWQSGAELAHSEVFPRVLWIAPSVSRAEALVEVCGRQPAEAWQLFVVTTRDAAANRLMQGAAS